MAEEYNGRFLARTKITKPFPVAVKIESSDRLNQVRFPFQGHVLEGSISALMCCRPGRKNSDAGIRFLSIENVVAFDRRALFCKNFKHLLIQLTCEHQLDFVLNSVFMIHHKIALLQSRSQASFHSCQ